MIKQKSVLGHLVKGIVHRNLSFLSVLVSRPPILRLSNISIQSWKKHGNVLKFYFRTLYEIVMYTFCMNYHYPIIITQLYYPSKSWKKSKNILNKNALSSVNVDLFGFRISAFCGSSFVYFFHFNTYLTFLLNNRLIISLA